MLGGLGGIFKKKKHEEEEGSKEKDKEKDKEEKKDKEKQKDEKKKHHFFGATSSFFHTSTSHDHGGSIMEGGSPPVGTTSGKQESKPLPNVPPRENERNYSAKGEALYPSEPLPPPVPRRGEEHQRLQHQQQQQQQQLQLYQQQQIATSDSCDLLDKIEAANVPKTPPAQTVIPITDSGENSFDVKVDDNDTKINIFSSQQLRGEGDSENESLTPRDTANKTPTPVATEPQPPPRYNVQANISQTQQADQKPLPQVSNPADPPTKRDPFIPTDDLYRNAQAQNAQPQGQPQQQVKPLPYKPNFQQLPTLYPQVQQGPSPLPPIPNGPQYQQYSNPSSLPQQIPPQQLPPQPMPQQLPPQQMPPQLSPIPQQLPPPQMPPQMQQQMPPQMPPMPQQMSQLPPQQMPQQMPPQPMPPLMPQVQLRSSQPMPGPGYYNGPPPPQQPQQQQQNIFACPNCGTQQIVDQVSEMVRCYKCGQIANRRGPNNLPPPMQMPSPNMQHMPPNMQPNMPPNMSMAPMNMPPPNRSPNMPPNMNMPMPYNIPPNRNVVVVNMPRPPYEQPAKHVWQIEYSELQIEQLIGQGAFGQVFRGKWNGTPVAIKKLLPEAFDKHNIDEFMSEISVMSKLRHPNLVLFMGACLVHPNYCIVTEFVARGSLFDMIHNKKIPINNLAMATDAARGVNYLHCFKPTIIHRDLKTANLLVDTSNNIKVCDFGFTVAKGGPNQSQLCGTLSYMAPEMMRGLPYDEKVDVFSFGVVLWEMTTVSIPHFNESNDEIMKRVLANVQMPIPPHIAPQIAQLIRDCWQVDPKRRPSFTQILNCMECLQRT